MSRKHVPIEGKRICGHRDRVGAAPTRRLRAQSCKLLSVHRSVLDLTRQADGAPLAATGWRGRRPLRDGLDSAYRYFLDDSAAAEPTRSAPRPAVAHHA